MKMCQSIQTTGRSKNGCQEHILTKWYFSYKEFAFVKVFAAAIGIFDFLAEDQGHLEEEEVSVTAFPNQSLGIPHLKGLLEYQLSLGVNVAVKP